MNVLNNHKRNQRNNHNHSQSKGFTIVELLIVIVVIAILAAISMAAYTNISQRAKNTAIINAASQSLKMINAYIAQTGEYPLKTWACITTESGCATGSAMPSNASFDADMATVGVLPKSVPVEGAAMFGVTYIYNDAHMVDEMRQPAYLAYYLFGTNQSCGVPGVMLWMANNTYRTTSATGRTSGSVDSDKKTLCRVVIPGPVPS
jgi:type IV pilus assembly protein PilA